MIGEDHDETRVVNDLALQLKEEKKAFINRKKETSILKRGGTRESEVYKIAEVLFRFIPILFISCVAWNMKLSF